MDSSKIEEMKQQINATVDKVVGLDKESELILERRLREIAVSVVKGNLVAIPHGFVEITAQMLDCMEQYELLKTKISESVDEIFKK